MVEGGDTPEVVQDDRRRFQKISRKTTDTKHTHNLLCININRDSKKYTKQLSDFLDDVDIFDSPCIYKYAIL